MSYEMIMKRAANLKDQDLGLRYKWDRTVFVANLSYECKWPVLKDFMKQNVGEVTFCDIFEENGRSSGVAAVEFRSPEDAKNACKVNLKLLNRKLSVFLDDEGRRTRRAAQHSLVSRVMSGRKGMMSPGNDYRPRGHALQSPVFRGPVVGLGSLNRPERLSPPPRGRPSDRVCPISPELTNEPMPEKLFGLLRRLGIEGDELCSHIIVSNLDNRVTKQKLYDVFALAGQILNIAFLPPGNGMSLTATIHFDRVVDAIQAIAMLDNQYLFDRRMIVKLHNTTVPVRDHPSPTRLPVGLAGIGERLNIEELIASSHPMSSDPGAQRMCYGDERMAAAEDFPPSSRRKRNVETCNNNNNNRIIDSATSGGYPKTGRPNPNSSGNFSRNRPGSPRNSPGGPQHFPPQHEFDIYDDLRRRLKQPRMSLEGSSVHERMGTSPPRRSGDFRTSGGRNSASMGGGFGRGFDDPAFIRSNAYSTGSGNKMRTSMMSPLRIGAGGRPPHLL